MGMTVQQLQALLAATAPGSTFTLADTALGIDGVKSLFDSYLPGSTLTVVNAQADATALTVSGTITIQSLAGAPCQVSFPNDGTNVTGILIQVGLADWSVSLSYLTWSAPFLGAMGFTSPTLLLSAQPNLQGVAVPALGAAAQFDFTGASGKESLKLQALFPSDPDADYTLSGQFTGVTFADLNTLTQFATNGNFNIIPTDVVPLAKELSLAGLSVTVNPTLNSIVQATITIQSSNPWVIIKDVFAFEVLGVTFSILYPTVLDQVSALIFATLNIEDTVYVSTGITIPGLGLQAQLQDPIPLTPVLNKYLPGVTLFDATLSELVLSLDVPSLTYLGQLDIVTDWELVTGIKLTELYLTVNGQSTNTPTGQLLATFVVGGVRILLGAGYLGGTTGWSFQGSTVGDDAIPVGEFAQGIADLFGVALPEPIQQAQVKNVQLGLTTGAPTFDFTCLGTTTIAGVGVDFRPTIHLAYDSTKQTWAKHFAGDLKLLSPQKDGTTKEIDFSLTFDDDATKTVISAEWKQEANPLQFADIASAFGFTLPTIPPSLDLALTEASFTYDFTNGILVLTAASQNYGNAVFVTMPVQGSRQYYFLIGQKEPINLSNLPLIGEELAKLQTISIDKLYVIIASAPITADVAKLVNPEIKTGFPTLPSLGTTGQVALSADFIFGDASFPLSLGMDGPQSTASNTKVGPPGGTGSTTVTTTSAAASDGTSWFNIQKSFGPVTFNKIGIRYADQQLWFYLSASLAMAGLTIELEGLGVGSPLTNFEPQFSLRGLGIDYKNLPLEIGGAFLRLDPKPPVTLEFDGAAIIQTGKFGLTAFGSYADISGNPSLFIFAQLNAALGGPPYFFVTGLAGGFGYNSNLRLPDINEIYKFPFVAGLTDPSVLGGKNAGPLQALEVLSGGANPWVTPELGQLWFAAGLMFSTVELLQTKALAVVAIGNDLSFSLIGLSTASFPPDSSVTYAKVELQIRVLFEVTKGFFAASAVLSPNSYLIDPSCVLTGGFAFYMWFPGNEHFGDFVLTLGGYSPYFVKPAWYPSIPAVGFTWSISDMVSLSGSAYMALTPAAIMAGGALAVNFHDGNLKAWFTAYADLIIWYKPFHFIATIGVSVGASYKLDVGFTSKTFAVELGADLTLWGPPTGGTVTVHWWVISFTVDFGADQPSAPPKVDWTGFTSLLPASNAAATINAAAGLAGEEKGTSVMRAADAADADPPKVWIVRPGTFSFSTASAIPATQLFLGTKSTTPYQQGKKLDIQPMQVTDLTATQRVSLVGTASGEVDLIAAGWSVSTNTGNVPTALWGAQTGTNVPSGDSLLQSQLTGLTLVAPPVKPGPSIGPVDVNANLSYDPLSPDGGLPLTNGVSPSGPTPQTSDQTIRIIETGLMASGTVSARTDLFTALQSLGADPLTNGSLTNLAAQAGSLFSAEPLILPSGGEQA
ncbi:MAG TPA: DUF6603 domain-containing protein [Symbiobacteriaceae bacterium]|nr:DUF6603 domain-containing protein [Symbiobacteriaceae bacterium]